MYDVLEIECLLIDVEWEDLISSRWFWKWSDINFDNEGLGLDVEHFFTMDNGLIVECNFDVYGQVGRIDNEGDFDLDVEWKIDGFDIYGSRFGTFATGLKFAWRTKVMAWQWRLWLENEGHWFGYRFGRSQNWVYSSRRYLRYGYRLVMVDGHWNITSKEVKGKRNKIISFQSLKFQRSGNFHPSSTWSHKMYTIAELPFRIPAVFASW